MIEYDDAKALLRELINTVDKSEERNEAMTRLQIIDRIFFDCLGWNIHEDIAVEDYRDGKYADYVFYAPRPVFILEAKREGVYFDIKPAAVSNERILKTIVEEDDDLKLAVEQVSNYCHRRGVAIAVVSNGHQIIIFAANRSDGIPFLDGKSIVFYSLEDMCSNFKLLWNCLSKPAIIEKSLDSVIYSNKRPSTPPKLSSKVYPYPGTRYRNQFQANLQILSELVIEDLTRDDAIDIDFLKECYCKSGSISQHSMLSKTILEDRYASMFDDSTGIPYVTPVTLPGQSESQLLELDTIGKRPIILIGDVGVGKSTFIQNFIKIETAHLQDSHIMLYLDLGSKGAIATDLRTFLMDELIKQFKSKCNIDLYDDNFVRGVYNLDIQNFETGIFKRLKEVDISAYIKKEIEFLESKINNKPEHIQQSIRHISRGRKKQVVIFLDNSDQRDDKTQQIAFLIAQEIAQNWDCIIFISIRPETFNLSVKSGALSGYHTKAFTIAPPKIVEVIKKRLLFSLKITSGEYPIRRLENTTIQLQALSTIIKMFLNSINSDVRRHPLPVCIDNIANGNVRFALEAVRNFFGSGHVDTESYLYNYAEDETANIPLHDFIRALIFGDKQYFHPNSSPITNLFSIYNVDEVEYFLLPLLLGYLASRMNESTSAGFVTLDDLYAYANGHQYQNYSIDQSINTAIKGKLIETNARRTSLHGEAPTRSVRITSLGLYHINHLISMFAYVDAIAVDIPISDDKLWESMVDIDKIRDKNERLKARLKRVYNFTMHLNAIWEKMSLTHPTIDWNAHRQIITNEISRIGKRVGFSPE